MKFIIERKLPGERRVMIEVGIAHRGASARGIIARAGGRRLGALDSGANCFTPSQASVQKQVGSPRYGKYKGIGV
jgi:hypothetical protein